MIFHAEDMLTTRSSLGESFLRLVSGAAGVSPPESNPRENLVVVQLASGSAVNLCANSEDESM